MKKEEVALNGEREMAEKANFTCLLQMLGLFIECMWCLFRRRGDWGGKVANGAAERRVTEVS